MLRLERALRAQQEPGTGRVQPLDLAIIQLGPAAALGVDRAQGLVEPARLGQHPAAAEQQPERLAVALGLEPGGLAGGWIDRRNCHVAADCTRALDKRTTPTNAFNAKMR